MGVLNVQKTKDVGTTGPHIQTQTDETQVETVKAGQQSGKTRRSTGTVINKVRQKHKQRGRN